MNPTPDNKKVETARNLVQLIVKEFKMNYPDLDVNSLDKTIESPSSLQKVDLTGKELNKIGFHPIVLSTICGTVFGDSSLSITKGYVSARLQNRHSTRQTEWFLWKTLCIFQEFTEITSIQFQLPDGHQEKAPVKGFELLGKLKVTTHANEKLTKLHNIVVTGGKKTIKRKWLNHMNNYFLMSLWLDDGGLIGTLGDQGVISTGDMPFEEAKVLADYLKIVWHIDCTAVQFPKSPKQKMQNGHTRINIATQESLMRLLTIIAPIIPVKSMLYKVCFYPESVSLQQRWASQDLKKLVRPEWHDELDKIYSYKKLKFLVNNKKA